MCIGFKYRKRGGGDIPFGHLAPVIQFVTPSRLAILAVPDCTVAVARFYSDLRHTIKKKNPICNACRAGSASGSSLSAPTISLFLVYDEPSINPLLFVSALAHCANVNPLRITAIPGLPLAFDVTVHANIWRHFFFMALSQRVVPVSPCHTFNSATISAKRTRSEWSVRGDFLK